jgi:uncharacterized protein (UPF0276 family)
VAVAAVVEGAAAVVANSSPELRGVGIGWRPELAHFIHRDPEIAFVEIIAESFDPRNLPITLHQLRERGAAVIPHGISLSLGGADVPDPQRIDHLAKLAEALCAPLVSEHLAFVRADEIESGHLLPVARTQQMFEIICENIRTVQKVLPVPLAIENITSMLDWPENEMEEGEFIRSILRETGAYLLLDLENMHANTVNRHPVLPANSGDSRSRDAESASNWQSEAYAFLDAIPIDRIAYCHVAGGMHEGGMYHDTHTRRVSPECLALFGELCRRRSPPGVLLERDDDFSTTVELKQELDAIRTVIAKGSRSLAASAS